VRIVWCPSAGQCLPQRYLIHIRSRDNCSSLSGDSSKVPVNTEIDLQRYQNDLAAITPGHEVQLFSPGVISRKFRNGYLAAYTARIRSGFAQGQAERGVCRDSRNSSAKRVIGQWLHRASPEFAHYTQFDSTGRVLTGGFGPESGDQQRVAIRFIMHANQRDAESVENRLSSSKLYVSKSLDDTECDYRRAACKHRNNFTSAPAKSS